ncbi:hypothetical protein D3C72_2478050 [compost metagenome]
MTQGQSKALTKAGKTNASVGWRLPVKALSQSWTNCAKPKITRITRHCCHIGNMRRRCCNDSTRKVMSVRIKAF